MSRRPMRRRGRTAGVPIATVGAIVAICAVAAIFTVILYYSFAASRDRASINPETLCPKAGPGAIHVVLIDRTDSLNPIQGEALRRRIAMWAQEVPKRGAFKVYEVGSAGVLPQPVVSVCNPGDGEDLSELTANKRMARKLYQERYEEPIEKMLAAMEVDSQATQSPIFEAVQAVAVMNFGPDSSAEDRRLILASDLLQHTSDFSLYRGVPEYSQFRQTAYGVSSLADLAGVGVEIHLLHRRTERHRQTDDLGRFWIDWFKDQGALFERFSPIPG